MNRKNIIWLFLIISGIYVWLAVTAPVDPAVAERYALTNVEITGLKLSVTLPVVFIWLLALYGFIKLFDYTSSIKKSPESLPLRQIGNGLMILAFGLPIASIASTIAVTQGAANSDLLPFTTIARNFFQLIFPLIAFCYIASGSQKLASTLSMKPNHTREKLFDLAFIAFASGYSAFIVDNPISDTSIRDIYFMPTWLIILTIVIPYLFTWYNGLLAVYNILRYKNNVKGHVYRYAFSRLATGLLVITIVSISTRILTTLNEQITDLELSPLLVLIYIFVVIYGLGYLLVASGAKRLSRLEEVL